MKRNKSIGIFDSGFGGLAIMKEIVRELPQYDFIYLGDTARVPYGTRSKNLVYRFTTQAVEYLFRKNCQLVIFACNTVSSDALWRIQHEYVPENCPDKKVLGVIVPAVEEAAKLTKNKKVGVMATAGTVAFGGFTRKMRRIDRNIQIFQVACPLLVPIVESGEHRSKIAEMAVAKYLAELKKHDIDTLILGCTHYGFLEDKIARIAGKKIKIVSEAKIVAEKLADYLQRHPEIEKQIAKKSQRQFYSTDLTDNFKKLGSLFFGKKIEVKKAQL